MPVREKSLAGERGRLKIGCVGRRVRRCIINGLRFHNIGR
jgi:hypothetical protein